MANVKLEIDGRPIEMPANSTVMEAANQLGIYIPHFCYHKKLSIAANCRMCLVQVEKAPKPLPACATPVTEGMKVQTHSAQAVQAQKGVMEFLLINHPLDCPICDQGGECQLQDLAVGYGASNSRYREPKRVVPAKDIGPLVAAEEMTRCIHCTRCVRFGQEIAGIMELGMANRGEHSEIMSFVGRTVDSELSGNMIDLCPVGALTSRPFRFTARSWELARRKSVSPHDGLGSNLMLQIKQDRVMRVLPLENESINECWLSDKDRFSYEGLDVERLERPMVKRDGRWQEVDWAAALEEVARGLRRVRDQHGAAQLGALASPHATFEELYLLGKLMRGLGSGNVDFRLRRSDFSTDGQLAGAPWLGMPIAEVSKRDRVLVIGSQLRKDHPLLAARMRVAARKTMQVNLLHCLDDEQLIAVRGKLIVPPAAMVDALAQVVRAVAEAKNATVPAELGAAGAQVSEAARQIAASMTSGERPAVFLGNLAQHHPDASPLQRLAQLLARLVDAPFGFLGEAANSVGGHLAGALPDAGALNARSMLQQPRKAYVLWNVEPELDCHDPHEAIAALRAADFVVACTPFRHRALEYADVVLPIGPFTETAGSFVNTEGRLQSFVGVVRPFAECRPGWKVLRVLGSLLGLPAFDHASAEDVRKRALEGSDIGARLSNVLPEISLKATNVQGLQRIAEVPAYFADSLVRRSLPLSKTRDALPPAARLHPQTMQGLGLREGEHVRVKQGGEAVLAVVEDRSVPPDCVRIASAHPLTADLGDMFGGLVLERVPAVEAVTA